MAFITQLSLAQDSCPELDPMLDALDKRLGMEVVLDEDTLQLRKAGKRESSWCPWPRAQLGIYVDGESTRGVEVTASPTGRLIELRIAVPALATWTDWSLGIHLTSLLLEAGSSGAEVEGMGQFLGPGLQQHFLENETRYLAELEAGGLAIQTAVAEGRTVRIGGPAGYAAIGPRSWTRIADGAEDEEELALRIVDFIQDSLDFRDFEDFDLATPLVLDGRDGRQVVTAVLAPGRDLILKDPEFILLSDDLEKRGGVEMFLLPFEQLEEAFPGMATWIDERCCAMPALSPEDWPDILRRLLPMLLPVAPLLDLPEVQTTDPTQMQAVTFPATRAPSSSTERGSWWKFW